MRFKLRTHRDYTNWHKWFAWHPMIVEDHFVWLEYIDRKWFCDFEYYEYSLCKND